MPKSQPRTIQHATNRRHRRTQHTQQLTRTPEPPQPICTSRNRRPPDSRVVQVLESVLSPIAQQITRSEPPGLRGATNQPRDTLTQLHTHTDETRAHVHRKRGGACAHTHVTSLWGPHYHTPPSKYYVSTRKTNTCFTPMGSACASAHLTTSTRLDGSYDLGHRSRGKVP